MPKAKTQAQAQTRTQRDAVVENQAAFLTPFTKRRFFDSAGLRAILEREIYVQPSWPDGASKLELFAPDEGLSVHIWRKRARAACLLTCRAADGPISLSLPRDFRGFLTVRSAHPVNFTRQLRARLRIAILMERDGVTRFFLGDEEQGRERERERIGAAGVVTEGKSKSRSRGTSEKEAEWRGDDVYADAGRWGVTVSVGEGFGFLKQL